MRRGIKNTDNERNGGEVFAVQQKCQERNQYYCSNNLQVQKLNQNQNCIYELHGLSICETSNEMFQLPKTGTFVKGKKRCCKCGGDHEYGQCGEEMDPKCCNCEGPHSAAYLGCEGQKKKKKECTN